MRARQLHALSAVGSLVMTADGKEGAAFKERLTRSSDKFGDAIGEVVTWSVSTYKLLVTSLKRTKAFIERLSAGDKEAFTSIKAVRAAYKSSDGTSLFSAISSLKKAKLAWESWNIPSASDKSVTNAYYAKELGCYIDGMAGTLGTTVQRRLDAIAIALFLIAVENPHRMWLALGSGRWSFILQFRRPSSGVLYAVWRAICQWENCRHLPRVVCQELFMAACLAPLMITKL